mmetsp:Transcript_13339/g.29663  ORF Transcript_13339/g.29663 Transcript_13339/m.29663 type:complete len:309 (+) Transcript_13339:249-1175(+)
MLGDGMLAAVPGGAGQCCSGPIRCEQRWIGSCHGRCAFYRRRHHGGQRIGFSHADNSAVAEHSSRGKASEHAAASRARDASSSKPRAPCPQRMLGYCSNGGLRIRYSHRSCRGWRGVRSVSAASFDSTSSCAVRWTSGSHRSAPPRDGPAAGGAHSDCRGVDAPFPAQPGDPGPRPGSTGSPWRTQHHRQTCRPRGGWLGSRRGWPRRPPGCGRGGGECLRRDSCIAVGQRRRGGGAPGCGGGLGAGRGGRGTDRHVCHRALSSAPATLRFWRRCSRLPDAPGRREELRGNQCNRAEPAGPPTPRRRS